MVVCDDSKRPLGLVMKDRFFRMLGSLYGMSLFGNKPISEIMDVQPLKAEWDVGPQVLIDCALSRDEATFYDAVIVTDRGKYKGILTVNDLLNVSRLLQRSALSGQVRTIRHTETMFGDIHQSLQKVSEAMRDAQVSSDRITKMTDQGRNQLEQMLQLFKTWSHIAVRQEQAIVQLTERTGEAHGIIRLIAELADQCNLLAINASIEAARAGHQGTASGVVADEMRSLADQTKQSAGRITHLLTSMSEAVQGVASLVGEGKHGADQGFHQVKQTEDIFARLWSSSAENYEAASRLILASQEAEAISNEIREDFHKLVEQINVTDPVTVRLE